MHAGQPVKFRDVGAVEAQSRQLREHGLGARAADIVFDQRNLDQNVVGLRENFGAAAV